jgi:hypothetical protein
MRPDAADAADNRELPPGLKGKSNTPCLKKNLILRWERCLVVTGNAFYHDTQTDTVPIIELKSGNGEKLDMRKKHHIL